MHETLITRLEALTGPSREVDAEIAKAVGWTTFMFGGAGLCWKDPAGRVHAVPPHFTGSIDAALTLMPKINRPNLPCFQRGDAKSDGKRFATSVIVFHIV